jgi:tetratricopeptide (TPR) repeat protein
MNRRGLLPLLALSMMLMAGCAELSARFGVGELDDDLDRLVAAQEYGRALALIEAVPERDPKYHYYHYRRDQILELAEEYETAQFAEAAQLQVDGDWEGALALYKQGLDKYPQSTLLQDGLLYLREAQAKQLAKIELELLISRGEFLVEALPRQRQLTEVDPEDRDARRLHDKLEAEALDVGAKLGDHGAQAHEEGNIALAKRTLPLATRLNPDPHIAARYQGLKALETAERWQQKTEKKKAQVDQQRQAVKARKQRSRDLYAVYLRAEQNQDLVLARDALRKIIRIDGPSSRAAALLPGLEERIALRVNDLIAQGGSSYSRGQFEEAVVFWEHALELDPDNEEAEANLKRAERVLAKLKELREKQATEAGQ